MTELTAYLGMGGNLGDRVSLLRQALAELNAAEGLTLREVSSFYETAPWGRTDQGNYINCAAQINFAGTPEELLACCQSVEYKLGRERYEKWAARTMDIDILHIEGIEQASPTLMLPHPYLTQRQFVLVPLTEIAPQLVIGGKAVGEWQRLCPDEGKVTPTADSPRDFDLRLIACVQTNGGIGRQNRLLWHLPDDMENFRRQTMGHTVIMGSNTRRSLPRQAPLIGRTNIVLSRRLTCAEGFILCRSETQLWEILDGKPPEQQNYVIGGAQIYNLLLPYANAVFLTVVKADECADTFFPPLPSNFVLLQSSAPVADMRRGCEFAYRKYKRGTWRGDIS